MRVSVPFRSLTSSFYKSTQHRYREHHIFWFEITFYDVVVENNKRRKKCTVKVRASLCKLSTYLMLFFLMSSWGAVEV